MDTNKKVITNHNSHIAKYLHILYIMLIIIGRHEISVSTTKENHLSTMYVLRYTYIYMTIQG